MSFELADDIQELKEGIRDFIDHEVEPHAMIIEEANEIPGSIIEKTKKMGLFALSVPEKYGGLGLSMLGKCAVLEELGRTHNGYTTVIGGHTGIGGVGIVEMGTEEQKRKYLPGMATGDLIGAFALTEPSAGSHASNLKTTAVKKGDKYILNGNKHYITNAPIAGIFTVMAVTDPTKGSRGITSFIVERDTPGLEIGAIEKKMGLHGSHSSEVFFEDCEVPAENILGQVGEGYINALKILANGRAGMAARNLGSSDKLLEMSLDFSHTRIQFDKPIFEQQIIQHY